MTVKAQTITLPIRLAVPQEAEPAPEWRRSWCYRHCEGWRSSEVLSEALSPHRGVYSAEIDRAAGMLTIRYDPRRFSLQQAQALAQEVGLVLGGRVHRCILDLPDAARAESAGPLEQRLLQLEG
ncbi:MAG: hypothetical protein HY326_11935, partial [Chloroflexi bacterium]|nr:hypothetical protein [Chloroflexota bacterium]